MGLIFLLPLLLFFQRCLSCFHFLSLVGSATTQKKKGRGGRKSAEAAFERNPIIISFSGSRRDNWSILWNINMYLSTCCATTHLLGEVSKVRTSKNQLKSEKYRRVFAHFLLSYFVTLGVCVCVCVWWALKKLSRRASANQGCQVG